MKLNSVFNALSPYLKQQVRNEARRRNVSIPDALFYLLKKVVSPSAGKLVNSSED